MLWASPAVWVKERNVPLELLYLTEVLLRSFIKARCKGGCVPIACFSLHGLFNSFSNSSRICIAFQSHWLWGRSTNEIMISALLQMACMHLCSVDYCSGWSMATVGLSNWGKVEERKTKICTFSFLTQARITVRKHCSHWLSRPACPRHEGIFLQCAPMRGM